LRVVHPEFEPNAEQINISPDGDNGYIVENLTVKPSARINIVG